MKRPILGLTEKTIIYGQGKQKTIIARIDSGATRSSIDKSLAKKLKLGPGPRTKLVKSSHGISRRPISEIKVKIDGKTLKGDFTLAERSHMTYKVLIGQDILKKGKFLIDPLK